MTIQEKKMDTSTSKVITSLNMANHPEDIFGKVEGTADEIMAQIKPEYRRLAKLVHPDVFTETSEKEKAKQAFLRLTALWEHAQSKISQGIYGTGKNSPGGTKPNIVTIKTRGKEFSVFTHQLVASGDISDLYVCKFVEKGVEKSGVVKIARLLGDNDLMQNEVEALHELRKDAKNQKFFPFLPDVLHNFNFSGREATVFEVLDGFYTLTDIREHYKTGVAPKDMAWMWRRLLMVLGYIHREGLVHGAVLPQHVLLHPALHGLVLVDWTYAVKNTSLVALSSQYEVYYPPEVAKKESATPGLDIYMGAKSMIYILGGDPRNNTFPSQVPKLMQSYFKGCLMTSPTMRPQYAWDLLDEFNELIEKLYGPRTFRPFYMPTR